MFTLTKDVEKPMPMTQGSTVPVAQNPLGQVTVHVIDHRTNAPLAGATVTVIT